MDHPPAYEVGGGRIRLQPSKHDAFPPPAEAWGVPKSSRDSGMSHWSHFDQGLYSPDPTLALRASLLPLLKSWWSEILCCLISIACLVALGLVLRAYDGQLLPAWSGGITLNTVVALLSTVCRTMFVLAASQALSQAKWNWFKLSPRPLTDLCAFDDASRGPWGSLKLVVATKGRCVDCECSLMSRMG